MDNKLKKVCTIEDISLNSSKSFNIEGHDILITNCDNKFFATGLKCTHLNLSLEGGIVEDSRITCPHHKSVFNLKDGDVLQGPQTVPGLNIKSPKVMTDIAQRFMKKLGVYKIEKKGNDIYVEI